MNWMMAPRTITTVVLSLLLNRLLAVLLPRAVPTLPRALEALVLWLGAAVLGSATVLSLVKKVSWTNRAAARIK